MMQVSWFAEWLGFASISVIPVAGGDVQKKLSLTQSEKPTSNNGTDI
jgi:hypothetical protein